MANFIQPWFKSALDKGMDDGSAPDTARAAMLYGNRGPYLWASRSYETDFDIVYIV
jgi:hypothetical protein